MDEARKRAVELSIGGTSYFVDNVRNAMLIRGARPDERSEVIRLIIEKRKAWHTWLFMTQRQWQRETRRPSRARHHDSIAIREKYVRISAHGR